MNSQTGSQENKRKYPRVRLSLPANMRVLLPNKDQQYYSLNTTTLGYGGVSFISPVALKAGTPVEMTITNFMDQITFTAEVTWARNDPKKPGIHVGLKITQIPDENMVKIIQLVDSNLSNSRT